MRRSLLDWLAPSVFVLGLLILAVGYGFFAGREGLFPASTLTRAEESARGVWEAYLRPPPFDRPGREGTPNQSQATTHLPDRLAEGVTLVVGYRPEGFGAWIVDAAGNVLHRWDATFSQVFGASAPQLQYQARDITIAWHGTHLYPNGDILFNFQDNSFPYGSGLVKLDKDGKVIWKLDRNTHHAVTVDADGTIWVPAHHYRPDGLARRARPQAVVLRGRGAEGLAGRQGARRDLDPRGLRAASRRVRGYLRLHHRGGGARSSPPQRRRAFAGGIGRPVPAVRSRATCSSRCAI